MYFWMKGLVVPGGLIRADAVDQAIAARRQQAADLAEIGVELRHADMLHHADRYHAVKLARELPIVDLPERDAIGDTGRLGAFARNPDLLGRDVDRNHMRTGRPSDMDRERPPARADLRHGHPGCRCQLCRKPSNLVLLCAFEAVGLRVLEERTGIVQSLIEEQSVEVSRQVVVVARIRRGNPERIGLLENRFRRSPTVDPWAKTKVPSI
jgi:hypothetical protein